VVGPRAQRVYEEKRASGEIPIKPLPEGVNCDIDRPRRAHREPQHLAKPSDLLIGAMVLVPVALAAGRKVRDGLANKFVKAAADKLKKSA